MEIIELLLIILGLGAVIVLSIKLITRIAVFYRTIYGFSIWSGVLFLIISIALLALIESDSSNNHILLSTIAGAIILFTLVQDIRLSGVVYGSLGFVFQIVMTFVIFFLFIIMLACFLGRIVTRQTRRVDNTLLGVGEEIRYAIILLPVFIQVSK